MNELVNCKLQVNIEKLSGVIKQEGSYKTLITGIIISTHINRKEEERRRYGKVQFKKRRDPIFTQDTVSGIYKSNLLIPKLIYNSVATI